MNCHVDEQIAFSYPADLRCTCTRHPELSEYHLRRGSLHIFITFWPKETREQLFIDAGHVRQVLRGSVDAEGHPMPSQDQWFEEYSNHGFTGRANSIVVRSHLDKTIGKQVDLLLSRDERRIGLRISDHKVVPLTLVDPLLESMALPGEARYEEALKLGPLKTQGKSPYVISLKYLSRFGRKAPKRGVKLGVEYQGPSISNQQLQAVERLIAAEERIYEQARRAVFRYYTEHIYSLLSTEIGPMDDLWPACQTVEQAVQLVKLTSLMVHEPREDGAVSIGLRFQCSWDEEHGMGLRVLGESIEAVGSGLVALDPGINEWPEFGSDEATPESSGVD